MTVSVAHPTVSRAWATHDELRQALADVQASVAQARVEEEDGLILPATGSRRVVRLINDLATRLGNLCKQQEADQDFAAALASKACLRDEWSRLDEKRTWIEHSLNLLIELLGNFDRPDSAGRMEIERQSACCQRLVTRFLADEFDIVRRGLEWHEP